MSAKTLIADDEFDMLVERLHRLTEQSRTGTVDRWEIRIVLAGSGVVPARAAAPSPVEDGLVASLRSICRRADRQELGAEAA